MLHALVGGNGVKERAGDAAAPPASFLQRPALAVGHLGERPSHPELLDYLADRVVLMSARPGRIKADIRIEADERTASFRKSPEFFETRSQVWDLLREEVLKTRALEEP